jgi:serine/threonine protein phosphatase PrpC
MPRLESHMPSAAKKLEPVREPPRPDPVVELTDEDFIDEDGEEKSGVRKIADLTGEAVEIREPGELQQSEVVEAFKIPGFAGMEVAATLEKKEERKGSPDKRNEDNVLADPETGLVGVFDGLSGEGEAGAGARASMDAEHLIPERFAKLLRTPGDLATMERRLVDHQLNRKNPATPELRALYQRQLTEMVEGMMMKDPQMVRKALALIEAIRQTNKDIQKTGGKTTATVGFVHRTPDGQRWAVVASVGDSLAMKRRKNGELVPVTKEDSLLNSLLDSGHLTEEQVHDLQAHLEKEITIPATLEAVYAMGGGPEEFEAMKRQGKEQIPVNYKLLKRAMVAGLGGSNAEPALSVRRLEPGDELIMASDGLTDKYETAEGRMDFEALGREFKGGDVIQDLNSVREAAKSKKSAAKKDDDIAVVLTKAA